MQNIENKQSQIEKIIEEYNNKLKDMLYYFLEVKVFILV